jgi:high-affinity nickel-transport protein
MGGSLAVLALGFFLGVRHATDPDHVIAVTTIVSRERSARGAALIGAAWGLGHTLTILVVGSGIILFSWVISPRLGLSLEFAVGLMLVMLGLLAIRDVWPLVRPRPAAAPDDHDPVHSHAHSHGDYVHTHPHQHDPETHPHQPDQTPVNWLDRHLGGISLYRLVRPLVVGMVHGLAGSAAVALLVLAAISDPRWSALYLLIFGIGTIVGMMLITAAIAVPFAWGRGPSSRFAARLQVATALISIAFGGLLAWQIGFEQGLFSADPSWSPHGP